MSSDPSAFCDWLAVCDVLLVSVGAALAAWPDSSEHTLGCTGHQEMDEANNPCLLKNRELGAAPYLFEPVALRKEPRNPDDTAFLRFE